MIKLNLASFKKNKSLALHELQAQESGPGPSGFMRVPLRTRSCQLWVVVKSLFCACQSDKAWYILAVLVYISLIRNQAEHFSCDYFL